MNRRQAALEYHAQGRHGKIEVVPTKPCLTQRDLSLAYSPGVAEPCLEIARDPATAYTYTAKGNLVAVVSNGTAVLGLGNIGALAGKPVMEGKGVLFKRFADIDVFDLELATEDPDELIRTLKILEPTFGGINLEDIKAPECFYIEQRLREELDIPVFHDDQHGTAIISSAAIINALELVGKSLDRVKIVFSGAGASAMGCARMYKKFGVRPENILMCDTKGVIYRGRAEGMNEHKAEFAVETEARTLADAMVGADVFIGLSAKGMVTADMLKTMADRPIVLAMANPDPEISYEEARAARPDCIMGTGRSDYPNQVNNVLGFPFIFRGALDVRARTITDGMMIAAARALAALAKQDVPETVAKAYGVSHLVFGSDYIIPKPFDYRVLIWVASAVAEAAMRDGVARIQLDLEEYREQLANRLGKSRETLRIMFTKARRAPKRVVLPEGDDDRVIRAAAALVEDHIARPILLGDPAAIRARAEALRLSLDAVDILAPRAAEQVESYAKALHHLRQRKGLTLIGARQMLKRANYFGAMMVRSGDADALVTGVTSAYAEALKPLLRVLGTSHGVKRAMGLHLMLAKNRAYFFADTTVNIEPTAEDLADIAIQAARKAEQFGIEPRVALLSFSTFGSVRHPQAEKVRLAVELARQKQPALQIDGEVMADVALSPEQLARDYPFAALGDKRTTVLVFPDLQSANIAYKLLATLGGAEAVGPILMGLAYPAHVLPNNAEVKDIVNLAAIAVVDAQERQRQPAAYAAGNMW
ncbi:MAG: NADP-dependent malic enzyme [Chloracidobacterium sp.]|uniref:NADP-dependent malic enzyme n=1 Tax=Chloracidobacterium validum TaxID=2821543 RepID=A0ABX8BA20_9BACT|nr:NADP-dependent malic enzyme [Chloracidobacterium validum]QUW03776.1 NADP-dependent malic enzyme [Chloracidobacterium validum]